MELWVISYWVMGYWVMGYWVMGYWVMGYWVMGYWVMGYLCFWFILRAFNNDLNNQATRHFFENKDIRNGQPRRFKALKMLSLYAVGWVSTKNLEQ